MLWVSSVLFYAFILSLYQVKHTELHCCWKCAISIKLTCLVNVNSLFLENHTILRSRECISEGSRLHWTDRMFCDGKLFLTLEHNNTWTAHVPEAVALKKLWDHETEHSKMERSRLQEGCIHLMRELKLSEEQSGRFFNCFFPALFSKILSRSIIFSPGVIIQFKMQL